MRSYRSAELFTLVVAALMLLAPLAGGAVYVFQKHQWAQARLEELVPRYSRLTGLHAQRAEISEVLAQARAVRTKYVYPADQDSAQAGNAAQQKVRDVLTNAGLQISSSQVLPLKAGKGFDRLPISVRAEGEWLAVQSALAVISVQTPILVVDEFEVQVVGGLGNVNPKVQPRLAVQFSFSALKEKS